MAPLILINDTRPDDAAARRRPTCAGRCRASSTTAPPRRASSCSRCPASCSSCCSNDTTCAASCPARSRDDHDLDHDHREPRRAQPRAAAPARPRRGAHHAAASGRSASTSTRAATLDHIEHWLEREGWIANFDLAAAGQLPAGRRGREFSDSEVYKYLEAVAWEIGRTGDRRARGPASARSSARVAAAQEPDGYLNTVFGRPGQGARWSDLEWGHELYCLGHLFQAAVARARTRPGADDGLRRGRPRRRRPRLRRCSGPAGSSRSAGTPRSRPALAELARVTGDAALPRPGRALRRAPRPRHPRATSSGAARTTRTTSRCATPTVLRGHAVRAGLPVRRRRRRRRGAGRRRAARGAGDAVGEHRRPAHLRHRRTGLAPPGRGVRRRLGAARRTAPTPRRARASASIMFSWRLLLAEGVPALRGPHRADPLQRGRHLAVGTTARRSSTPTPCTSAGPAPRPPTVRSRRAPRPRCGRRGSRCPAARPNVARTLASLAAYVATTDDEGLQLHQYAPAEIRTTLPDGTADRGRRGDRLPA